MKKAKNLSLNLLIKERGLTISRLEEWIVLPSNRLSLFPSAPVFDQTFQSRDIFRGHAGGDPMFLQALETFAGFIKRRAHIFLSPIGKDRYDHTMV
jgi:hypothetical protein